MKHFINIFLLLATTGFYSCQSVVKNVDLPEIEIKSVVQLRYDKALNGYQGTITKSNPIFGKPKSDFDVIEDAVVTIEGGGELDTVFYNEDNETYQALNKIQFNEGESYNLFVALPSGENLTSSAVYPFEPKNIAIEVDSVIKDLETIYKIRISWDDLPGIEEYYQVEYYYVNTFNNEADTFGSYGQVLIGDNNTSRVSHRFESYVFNEPGSSSSYSTFMVISGISKEQYEYSKFLANYNPENPFAEPVTVPSNITGGLGMFVLKNSVVKHWK